MWIHLSKHKIDKILDYEQGIHMKPRGLWFAKLRKNHKNYFNTEWREISNEMGRKYNYSYQVIINKPESLIIINDADDLNKFIKKYSVLSETYIMINWKRISNDYAGILINNYQKILKYINDKCGKNKKCYWKYLWFTIFDFDGGCIWKNTPDIIIKKMS